MKNPIMATAWTILYLSGFWALPIAMYCESAILQSLAILMITLFCGLLIAKSPFSVDEKQKCEMNRRVSARDIIRIIILGSISIAVLIMFCKMIPVNVDLLNAGKYAYIPEIFMSAVALVMTSYRINILICHFKNPTQQGDAPEPASPAR